jgi:hypothetical protein
MSHPAWTHQCRLAANSSPFIQPTQTIPQLLGGGDRIRQRREESPLKRNVANQVLGACPRQHAAWSKSLPRHHRALGISSSGETPSKRGFRRPDPVSAAEMGFEPRACELVGELPPNVDFPGRPTSWAAPRAAPAPLAFTEYRFSGFMLSLTDVGRCPDRPTPWAVDLLGATLDPGIGLRRLSRSIVLKKVNIIRLGPSPYYTRRGRVACEARDKGQEERVAGMPTLSCRLLAGVLRFVFVCPFLYISQIEGRQATTEGQR